MTDSFDTEKSQASAWFPTLRNDTVAAFEGLDQSHSSGPMADAAPGAFEISETTRTSEDGSDAGGGLRFRRHNR